MYGPVQQSSPAVQSRGHLPLFTRDDIPCAGADYRPSSIHVGVAGGGLWRSLQLSLLLYLPTVIRLCIISCNEHLNFHVRCICRGKITATEGTAQCGDRSVVHTLPWCSAQPKLLQGLERRLKYAVCAEYFAYWWCAVRVADCSCCVIVGTELKACYRACMGHLYGCGRCVAIVKSRRNIRFLAALSLNEI